MNIPIFHLGTRKTEVIDLGGGLLKEYRHESNKINWTVMEIFYLMYRSAQ